MKKTFFDFVWVDGQTRVGGYLNEATNIPIRDRVEANTFALLFWEDHVSVAPLVVRAIEEAIRV